MQLTLVRACRACQALALVWVLDDASTTEA
jgi:hypothetical protein